MRIIRPPLLALAALLGAVSAPPLPAQTIDTILIDNTGVFEGPGFLSRLAAHTHITTQARVIRRAILLRQGDSFDPNLVAASERALWTLGVFRSVKLDTLRLADGRLALRVATADGWSARPVLDYATVQGAKSWELGVLEQNFLGTATQVFATYRSTPDRGWLLFQYWNPHFLSPATVLFLRHVQLSNGRHWVWMGGLPFRHAGARSSVTTEGWAVEERTLVFEQGGATLAPSRMRTLQFRLNAAYAVHAAPTSYVRTWVALRGSRDSWAPDATTPFNTLATAAAGAGVELGLARYRVTQALNTHSRREHVDVSQVLRLGLWSAPRRWGTPGDRAGFGLEGRWQGAIAGPRGHAVLRVEATAARAAATGALDSAGCACGPPWWDSSAPITPPWFTPTCSGCSASGRRASTTSGSSSVVRASSNRTPS